MQRDAQTEAEVFAEIKNVEKLLTLLSTSSSDLNVRDNEEITKLYHSTLAIRPKLIELIGKYSQKKDDFTQLNEKFIKARRDFENLLETSMSQPPPQQYGRPNHQPAYSYGGGGGVGAPPSDYPPHGAPPGDPQRFYSPSKGQGPYQPPSAQHASQNAPTPFFVVPKPAPSSNPMPSQPQRNPSAGKPPVQGMGGGAGERRPQSTYDNPQELATGMYDSPIDPRQQPPNPHFPNLPPLQQQQQAGDNYSPSLYSPTSPGGGAGAGGGEYPPYNAYHAPPAQQPPQPPQAQHPSPHPSPGPYPVLAQDPTPAQPNYPPQQQQGGYPPQPQAQPPYAPPGGLPPQQQPPQAQAPYAPPGGGLQQQQPPFQPHGGGLQQQQHPSFAPQAAPSAPADYYRTQGGPGNELFMDRNAPPA
ncbi:MAG: ESCRT-0 subunit protein hse1 [Vezdaea acicularis]|nr:MAG: ESCRT-0 subunit protein hse1 [Vezdaea acicularis]